MATAILEINGEDFRLNVFGEPATLAPALRDIVTDDEGHGKSFESPAELAHDVLNSLAQRGYRPVRDNGDEYDVDYFYVLYTAPNGQALADADGPGYAYRGRVKTIPA